MHSLAAYYLNCANEKQFWIPHDSVMCYMDWYDDDNYKIN